jgi:hypothetical protein
LAQIEVAGKTFTAKKCTLFVLLKTMKLEEKIAKAQESEQWDEYAKLWMDKVALYLEGDTIVLNPDNITPVDYQRLNGFFTQCLAEVMPLSDDTSATSEDSTAGKSNQVSQQGTTLNT